MTTAPESTFEERARADVESVNRAAAGDRTVKIGIVTPLTGPGDPTAGELTVRGARIGAEYVREHGGIRDGLQIEFVLRNDQETVALDGDMQRSAVGAFAKVAQIDDVLAALGPWHLRTADHTAELAERLGVPLFIESAHSGVTRKRRRTVFRTFTNVAERVPPMVEFAAEQGFRKVALLAANTVFGLMTADTFEEVAAAHPHDFEVLRIDFDQESTFDLTEELAKIKDFAPDVFVNVGVIRTNYLVIQQATEAGLLPATPLMVPFQYPLRSADYWRLAGEGGNHVVWPATVFSPYWEGLTEVGRWFVERYTAVYGAPPPDTALNSFTDITLIAQALENAAEVSRDGLIDALEAGTFDTWRGPVSFERGEDHWHHSPPEVILQHYTGVGQTITDLTVVHPAAYRTGDYTHPSLGQE
ncbi:ABC transporter substrate-binding protein [Kitasatospora sp. NPDC004240]